MMYSATASAARAAQNDNDKDYLSLSAQRPNSPQSMNVKHVATRDDERPDDW